MRPSFSSCSDKPEIDWMIKNNVNEFDIIFGEYYELVKLSQSKVSLPSEINEFYEAINNQDEAEILDEAIGLIRAAQQFSESKRVLFWWEKIYTDVKTVLSNKQKFDKAFVKWKKRKTRKKQALDVTKQSLIDFAKLFK